MAYVQQTCEGYSKRSLMGNWQEERLYPQQAFRENLTKVVTLPSFSPGTKKKISLVSTAEVSRGPYLGSKGGPSGKLTIVSS